MGTINNLQKVNFNFFKSFEGVTIDFESHHVNGENYRATAILRLNGKLFLEYDCEAHKSYFLDLVKKTTGKQVSILILSNYIEEIANQLDWELTYPQ